MRKAIEVLLISLLLLLTVGHSIANDTPNTVNKLDTLTQARQQISQKNWPAAIAELKRVNESDNADWNNLMGFSLRKGDKPDLIAAERYYSEALRIDPKHRGALEYSGELYLMTGNLSKAEERLSALGRICFFPCEEYTDLKNAVLRFKTNGNKYVAPQ